MELRVGPPASRTPTPHAVLFLSRPKRYGKGRSNLFSLRRTISPFGAPAPPKS